MLWVLKCSLITPIKNSKFKHVIESEENYKTTINS